VSYGPTCTPRTLAACARARARGATSRRVSLRRDIECIANCRQFSASLLATSAHFSPLSSNRPNWSARSCARRCTARAGIERSLISVLDQLCTLRRRRERTVRGGELDMVFFSLRAHVRGDKVKMVILTRHLGAGFLLASLAKESSIERADRFIIVTAVTRERESEKRINVENKR